MNSLRSKVLITMGIVMLFCLLTMGFFAFPIGIPVCTVIGLIYGLKCKDRKFAMFSSIALTVGIGWGIYTLLLIEAM